MYDGSVDIQTDKEVYTIAKDDVLIIPSGNKYRLLPPKNNAVYIALNFDYTQSNSTRQNPIPPVEADTFNSMLIPEKSEDISIPFFNEITYISGMKKFSSRLTHIEREYSQKLLYCDFQLFLIKRKDRLLYQNSQSHLALTVNFNTTEKTVHVSKRLVHSELFFFSSQDRRTVNKKNHHEI